MKSELVRATNHLNIGKGQCNGWIEQPEEIKSGIYCWTCKANGKRYIGQSSELRKRKRQFLNFSQYHYGGVRINNARRKYNSRKMWNYSIIEYCSVGYLDEREIAYITASNTTQQSIGYNLSIGGGGYSMRGELNPRWGVKLSDEMKEKISLANSIPVNQYDLDGNFIREWQSATTAAKELGLNKSNINSCCCGRAKSAGGYMWGYKSSENELQQYNYNHRRRAIFQIDINTGEILNTFESATQAAKMFNVDMSGIAATCRGRHSSYCGFIWVYQSNYCVNNIKDRQNKIERARNHIIDDATRKLMSERKKGSNNPNYGKKHTDEVKQRISSANKGRKHKAIWNFKAVNQYTKEGVFVRRWESATEAELALNKKKSGFINKVLKGIKPTAYGFKWEYADK